jgi:hypothetical protein
MGVYKYDAINDELIPIAGVPSVPGIEDKVSTYTADATYWDTSPTAASIKPVTSGGIKTEIDKKLSTYAVDSTAWDAAPTTASTKPVISDGIKTQFDLVHNELSDVNNILGSKNILPNSATTQVINGITYTVAADGSINVNGTASADSILHIVPGTTGKLSNIFSKGGNYIISVGTTGTGVNVFFGIEYTGSTWDIAEWLTYSTRLSKEIYIDGTKLNNSSSYIESYIKVNSGTTVSNIKVYPMLRPSSVRDDTYVPYSKTNYELTTEISNLANQLNFSITSMNLSRTTLPAGQQVSIGTLPSGGVYLVSVNLRLQTGTFSNGVIVSPCDGTIQHSHDYGQHFCIASGGSSITVYNYSGGQLTLHSGSSIKYVKIK